MNDIGHFDGRAAVELLSDGRRVRLIEPFAFVDGSELRWAVPSGAIVDGASIPRPLWTLIGGPFEGLYRNASIVHDWFCDIRTRPWRQVHRVFYEAMLASGVSSTQAKLLYGGVFWGGPRWSATVVENSKLKGTLPSGTFEYISQPQMPSRVYHLDMNDTDVESLRDRLAASDLSLESIESFVESRTT